MYHCRRCIAVAADVCIANCPSISHTELGWGPVVWGATRGLSGRSART
jgi:hypothetical protein